MVTTDTIIRVGRWRAATDLAAHPGREVAPVIDGTATIGHLWRYAPGHYQASLTSPGPGGCYAAHNHSAAPVSGVFAATERADDDVIEDADVGGVKMPHRWGAGGAGVFRVAA